MTPDGAQASIFLDSPGSGKVKSGWSCSQMNQDRCPGSLRRNPKSLESYFFGHLESQNPKFLDWGPKLIHAHKDPSYLSLYKTSWFHYCFQQIRTEVLASYDGYSVFCKRRRPLLNTFSLSTQYGPPLQSSSRRYSITSYPQEWRIAIPASSMQVDQPCVQKQRQQVSLAAEITPCPRWNKS